MRKDMTLNLDYCFALCKVRVSSQKRLFEIAAEEIARRQPKLNSQLIHNKLLEREKLGSTGLGRGIAIPHCRIEDCQDAVGCILTLNEPLDFNAPDNAPVDLVFFLLVPEAASKRHLKILADLVTIFSDIQKCLQLRNTTDACKLSALMFQGMDPGCRT